MLIWDNADGVRETFAVPGVGDAGMEGMVTYRGTDEDLFST